MDHETKEFLIEQLIRLSKLEKENKRLNAKNLKIRKKKEMEIAVKKERIEKYNQTTKKDSFFKTISSIFCVPT